MARNNTANYPDSNVTGFLIVFALILLLYGNNWIEGQKLALGVWVVGGGDKENIHTNWENFRVNVKELLEEGYRKVHLCGGHEFN